MGLLSIFGFGSSGCLALRADKGDAWVQKLRIGMPMAEVRETLGTPKWSLELSKHLYSFYLTDRAPYDLLTHVKADSACWLYSYPVSSNVDHDLCVFHDEKDRVLGWVKDHSELSRDKFMHEKLTSRLKADTLGAGMSHAEVYALIGKPDAVMPMPHQRTPDFYEDRYWLEQPITVYDNMELYSYVLPTGQKRRVFLVYTNGGDELHFWGYDHAWEEAERYLAEQAARNKQ
jgi:hypothetical protein